MADRKLVLKLSVSIKNYVEAGGSSRSEIKLLNCHNTLCKNNASELNKVSDEVHPQEMKIIEEIL